MHSKNKILHIFGWDKKFCPPFIEFVREHFDHSEHCYIIHGLMNGEPLPISSNVVHYPNLLIKLPDLLRHIRSARKVVLHGLFSSHLLYALMLQPWLLKKCYWTIWGGDLYVHNKSRKDWRFWKNEIIRRFVIGRIGHFITYIKADYELANQWYGAKGQLHECFVYTSNLYYELPYCHEHNHNGINILVGNSADPSNNHIEILDKLKPYKQEDIKIYCPLSYGDPVYAQEVSNYGRSIFEEKFIALRDFIQFDQYQRFLGTIDVAIFNHKRQQAVGNIKTLIGMGKRVHMQRGVTTWHALDRLGIHIFDVKHLAVSKLPIKQAKKNQRIIKDFFSEANLIAQLKNIFEVV